jgi:hypothetical protein
MYNNSIKRELSDNSLSHCNDVPLLNEESQTEMQRVGYS